MDRGRIECPCDRSLGRLGVAAVTRADVETFMQKIAAGATATPGVKGVTLRSTHRVMGGKGAASRTVEMLSAIFAFATQRGLRSDNPCEAVKRYADRQIERFLTVAELQRLGDALADLEDAGYYSASALAGVRLLALTGCRRNEVMQLQWAWVDFDRACLRLPDSKGGKKVVPLGAASVAVLEALPRSSPLVFPGDTGGPYAGIQRVWKAIRTRAELPELRLHDLRHSFASVGASGGDSLLILGKVLGHKNPLTTQRYAHLADNPVKLAADRSSGAVAASLAPIPASHSPSAVAPVDLRGPAGPLPDAARRDVRRPRVAGSSRAPHLGRRGQSVP